jgi:RimJ/RimL family protein N-acetyltransferase
MIRLSLWTRGNPFERFPALRDIWPEPHLQALAEEATLEEMEFLAQPGAPSHGPLFLAVDVGEDGSQRVVGMSGFYLLDLSRGHIGLRWHGVIPAARGQGASAEILEQVIEAARDLLPQATEILEFVPQIPRGEALTEHFRKLGFAPHGEPETYDWAPHPWQGWAKPIWPSPEAQLAALAAREAESAAEGSAPTNAPASETTPAPGEPARNSEPASASRGPRP